MGAERELLEKIAVVQKKGVIGAEDPVSYTHLDVYKRQFLTLERIETYL